MKLGIVGLPNVGKSTLFNAITNAGAECANYPFCTIEPNVGTVAVPDARLDWLSDLYHPEKDHPCCDRIRGHRRSGQGRQSMVRGWATSSCPISAAPKRSFMWCAALMMKTSSMWKAATDPIRDIGIIDLELIMADLEMVDRRIDKAKKASKGDKKFLREVDVFHALREHLNNGGSVRSYECEPEDMALIATSDLLSLKPIIYAANLDEDTFGGDYESNPYYQQVKELADKEGAQVMPVCARLEEELSQMEEDEKAMFMEELGHPGIRSGSSHQGQLHPLGAHLLPDLRRG